MIGPAFRNPCQLLNGRVAQGRLRLRNYLRNRETLMSHNSGEFMPVVVSMLSLRWLSQSLRLSLFALIAITTGVAVPTLGACLDEASGPDSGTQVNPESGFDMQAYRTAVFAQRQKARQLVLLNEPLLGPEAEDEFTQIGRTYRQLLTAGPNLNSAADRKVIQKGLEFKILRASDPAIQISPKKMGDVIGELRRDLRSVGSQINNAQNKQRFREDVMKEALTHLKKLLSNNMDARIFALTAMVYLEVVQAGFGQKRILVLDAVPATFREVLADPEQPDAVKSVATIQIGRYLRKADTLPVEQMDLARAMVKELSRFDTEDAYQLSLLDSLASIKQAREIVGKPNPIVFDAFIAVMSDRNRFIHVRCRAAAGVGLAGYDSQFNFDPIAWKVCQLSVEAAQFYNKAPANALYQRCGMDLYLAFHPASGGSSDADNGMLNRAPRSGAVKDAYEQCLQIAGPMIFTQRAIPNPVLVQVNTWTQANVPANLNWDSSGSGKPIVP